MRLRDFFPLLTQALLWPPMRTLFKLFGRFETRGLENLDALPLGGAIFASNHTSELDVILIPAAMPFRHPRRPLFYTSRERAFYSGAGWRQHFYGGWLFRALGGYPVVAGLHDYEKSLKRHVALVRSGATDVVFPEGKVCDALGHCEGRGGVGYLSHATGAPIVPVAVSGAYNISIVDFFTRKRHFIVSFGKPIYPAELFPSANPVASDQRDDFKKAAAVIMRKISELYVATRA